MREVYFEGDKRKDRLGQIPKGPGTFCYTGEAEDTEWIPAPKRHDGRKPVLDAEGMPVIDASGRPRMQPSGSYVLDDDGHVVMGGPPEVKRTPIDVYKLWGKEFPKGEKVAVKSPKLALKLRCLAFFVEVEAEVKVEASEPKPAPKKRGRPPKAKAEAPESPAG